MASSEGLIVGVRMETESDVAAVMLLGRRLRRTISPSFTGPDVRRRTSNSTPVRSGKFERRRM